MYLFINKLISIFGFRLISIDKKPYNTIIVSFPKCGRTWLRLIIGKVFAGYLGINKKLNTDALLNLPLFSELSPLIPKVGFGHEASGNAKVSEIDKQKKYSENIKIIFLVRDPRDVLVSQYFSETKRKKNKYKYSISKFIYKKRGSFDTILEFYNSWGQNKHIPKDFLLVRYEDLHSDTLKEIKRVINFIGVDVDDDILNNAINFSSFKNMRKIETDEATKSVALKPLNIKDTSSYKTRKGKIGDYKNYFSEEEIEYLTNKIKENLNPFFGYTNL